MTRTLPLAFLVLAIGCLGPVDEGRTGGPLTSGDGGGGGGGASNSTGSGGAGGGDGGGAGGGDSGGTCGVDGGPGGLELCIVSDSSGRCGLFYGPNGGPVGSASGQCVAQLASAGCSCALDATGAVTAQCTGACLPPPPGVPEQRTCFTTNCGLVQCEPGTTCAGPSRCERCEPATSFVNELWQYPVDQSWSRCEALPRECAANQTCECLLRSGPWLDLDLAADAGLAWPVATPPPGKQLCSYRVTCGTLSSGALRLICHAA